MKPLTLCIALICGILFFQEGVAYGVVDSQWGTITGLVPVLAADRYKLASINETYEYSVKRGDHATYTGYKRPDRYAIALNPGEKAVIGIDAGRSLDIKVFTNGSAAPASAYLSAITELSTSGGSFTISYDSRYPILYIYVGLDGLTPGTFDVYYTITSQITLVGTPPTVTLAGANPLTIARGTAYTDPGATATDAKDGTLTPVITRNTVATGQPGAYLVTWTATNSSGLVGSATRTVNVVNLSYADWCTQHGLSGSGATETSDPNHTGVSNLAAYAFGVNPQAPDRSQLPMATPQDNYLQISYPRLKDAANLTYTVEVSSDLKTWNSGAGYTQQVSVVSLDATREQVIERDVVQTSSGPCRFMRVKITPVAGN